MNTTKRTADGRTLSDRVQAALLERIIAGGVAPGEFVREQELSASLGVSRTPVREALARLAAEGFLERMPHRGYRVRTSSFERLLESYPIIATLEVLAGRLAFAGADAGDREALRALNERLARAVSAGNVADAIELNDRFHGYVAELAGNRQLAALLDELKRPLRRLEEWYYSGTERGERSVAEHSALIDALEGGHADRALAIFENNMALTTAALARERGHPAGRAKSGAPGADPVVT